ncbi:hypothetical protein [Sporomusa acidovorans]|uniref:Uncharacterized protein n=1 Tax=Sporomusa acidovorans (strain ATCC 49682 / DSM 3132 / Mol) TaxID=1123286 RepID=A0ABZ3JBF1_SPOA4|nr:hypothetical protein [Sporomusa acidovorans]OZC13302.1 hypothetical protein SPACI_57970 [Sporomusa acidovorans DSM 3132]SDD97499.1 hypothetical protein SAMN04488499_100652 [Sporomusa acidovorans]
MLASYDKIIKYIVEKIQSALLPLEQIAKSQEIIIAQNKQIIDLLTQLNTGRQNGSEPCEENTPAPVVVVETDLRE